MPELPEVQTTVEGVRRYVKDLLIKDVWTDYGSSFHAGKENIKDRKYFEHFKKEVVGRKVADASRIGKNVLIHLSGGKTMAVHMKMTGHLLYGRYAFDGKRWAAAEKGPLRDDGYNRFIRLVFSLSNGRHLALCDLRRFAKVSVIDTKNLFSDAELRAIGPDPLSKDFTFKAFKERLMKRPSGKIKEALMDQRAIAGIGNIYSDEILWRAGVHPQSTVSNIPERELKAMHKATIETLSRGISLGGDSMSDYRNIKGEPGAFQSRHGAYRLTGKSCSKKGCGGVIARLKVSGRSAHFCDMHQRKF